jgi:hypothetical protein
LTWPCDSHVRFAGFLLAILCFLVVLLCFLVVLLCFLIIISVFLLTISVFLLAILVFLLVILHHYLHSILGFGGAAILFLLFGVVGIFGVLDIACAGLFSDTI